MCRTADLTTKNTKFYVKILHADFADYADFNPCKIRFIRDIRGRFNHKEHKVKTQSSQNVTFIA